jgi:hypothetical protein
MKTYLSVGIGDMMCLDSLLTQDERNKISEIYWACRFGKDMIPLFDQNKYYPNLQKHHTVSDEVGITEMNRIDCNAVNFWHFRPDFENNFVAGLRLFGIESLRTQLNIIDAAAYFNNPNKIFINSSFLDSATQEMVDWRELGVSPHNYILFHYPTSTRPRTDIATITQSDWDFVENLSQTTKLKVVVISDCDIEKKISNSIILVKPNIVKILALIKFTKYYAGCDSFVSILSSKILDPKHLFIKSHDPNIQSTVLSHTWLQRFFQPHRPDEISKFYKNFIG